MNGLDGFDPNDALTHAFQAFIVFLRLACFGDISNRLRARSFCIKLPSRIGLHLRFEF